MRYKVSTLEFNTFEEVVQWAWDEMKIELMEDRSTITEEDRQVACSELSEYVNYIDQMESSATYSS